MADSIGQIMLDLGLNQKSFNRQLNNINGLAQNASNKISSSFKKIGVAVAAAFSVKAISAFAKQCTAAADLQTLAEARLTTVMKQRMKATDSSIKKVKEYASAQQELGVVGDEVQLAGAQQLATFLKEEESLKALIPAMNNLAVQQNGVNVTSENMTNIGNLMGKAMQGQVAALTRVGITFDEAQEKILKYGTEEQKAATLAQVITDNVGQMNSAIAKTPAGKVQQLKNSFGDVQETLGRALQNVFVPLLGYINTGISKLAVLAQKFEEFTQKIFGNANETSAATGDAMSGMTDGVSNLGDEADTSSEAIDGIAKSADKVNKSLAGFDKLNVMSPNDEAGDEGSGSAVANTPTTVPVTLDKEKTEKSFVDGLQNTFSNLYEKSGAKAFVDNIQKGINRVDWSSVGDNCKTIFEKTLPIAETSLTKMQKVGQAKMSALGSAIGAVATIGGKSIQTLSGGVAKWITKDSKKIQGYISTIGDNVADGYNNLSTFFDGLGTLAGESIDRMRPQMENAIANLLSGLTTFAGSLGEVISGAFSIATASLVEWINNDGAVIGEFFDNLQISAAQVMNFFGEVFGEIGTIISQWWNGDNGGAVVFQNVCDMFTNIGTTLMHVYNALIQPVFDQLMSIAKSAWDNCLKPVFTQALQFFTKVWDCISTLWNNVLSPVVNWIIDFVKPMLVNTLNAIKGVFDTVFSFIGGMISSVMKAFGGLLDFITGVFSGNWEKAWQGIADFFSGIWNGMWNVVKTVVNLIADGLNTIWTGIYNTAEGIVNSIGGIAGAIGSIFGQDWSFKMPDQAPLIPKLEDKPIPKAYGKFANGGIVKAPTLALVGDNPGAGTGDPEVISPLSKLQNMIGSTQGDYGVVVILREVIAILSKIHSKLESIERIKLQESDSEIVVMIDGKEVFRAVKDENDSYIRRHGGHSAFA